MANDSRDMRSEQPAIVLAWGIPADAGSWFEDTVLWWTGGASLLAWTVLALLLTWS
jgi:hypothetical protein